MDELTKELIKHADDNQRKWRDEWNKIDLPILCFAIFIFLSFIICCTTGKLFIPILSSFLISFIIYICGYDNGKKK